MEKLLFSRRTETKVSYQEWRDLLFLHWEVAPHVIQETLPVGLRVDTFEEKAYLSVIPFLMPKIGLSKRFYLPSFLETNVRTYVKDKNGIRGIWFYSLYINSLLAKIVASAVFKLPYKVAQFSYQRRHNNVEYRLTRRSPQVEGHFIYSRNAQTSVLARPGSLEFFLIERYVMFTFHADKLYCCRVHHAPYELETVKLVDCIQTLDHGVIPVKLAKNPDLYHFSPGVDVDIFTLHQISSHSTQSIDAA